MRRNPLRALAVLLVTVSVIGWPVVAEPPAKVIPATGSADKRLAPFDKLMTDFLKAHPKVPGAALAVAGNGKLVYGRGFGYADRERKQPVQPNSLFRIASVSKPFTAVAILQLVERSKLKLNDKVFDVLQLQPPKGRGANFDPRWRQVTIQHLLQHTGGWDSDKGFEPMGDHATICKELNIALPAGPSDIIRYMLRRRLDFNPGARFAYSNFGYCLLGRVIEKVSGKRYESYVRQEVLLAVGAGDTRLGRTLLEDRFPGEVWYDCAGQKGPAVMGSALGKSVPMAYGAWCLETMDSHGGWVASVGDLVRFATAFDSPQTCKILNAQSIATMFAPPPGPVGHEKNGKVKEVYYGCGWWVRPNEQGKRNTYHFGLLEGSSSLLVRRADGLTWAALFNYSKVGDAQGEPAEQIDGPIHDAANAVQEWP